jgi:hypothetical protein
MFLVEGTTSTTEEVDVQISGTPEAILEALMDAQSELHNLNMSMIRLEHKAVVSENAQLLEAGIGDYWKKFVAWIKKMWDKVKAWFREMWTKMTTYFMNTEKFIEKYGGVLKSSSLNIKGLKAAIYPENKFATMGPDFDKAAMAIQQKAAAAETMNASVSGEISISDMKDTAMTAMGAKKGQTFSEALKGIVFGKKAEKAVDGGYVKNCLAFLERLPSIKENMKKLQEIIDKAYSSATKEANMLTTVVDGKDEQKKAKEYVARTAANAAQATSQTMSIMTSCVNEAAGHCIGICKAALSTHSRNGGSTKEGLEDSVLSGFGYAG